jgi:hypothetical protein
LIRRIFFSVAHLYLHSPRSASTCTHTLIRTYIRSIYCLHSNASYLVLYISPCKVIEYTHEPRVK